MLQNSVLWRVSSLGRAGSSRGNDDDEVEVIMRTSHRSELLRCDTVDYAPRMTSKLQRVTDLAAGRHEEHLNQSKLFNACEVAI